MAAARIMDRALFRVPSTLAWNRISDNAVRLDIQPTVFNDRGSDRYRRIHGTLPRQIPYCTTKNTAFLRLKLIDNLKLALWVQRLRCQPASRLEYIYRGKTRL